MFQRHLLEVRLATVHRPTNTAQSHVQKRPYTAETTFLAVKQSHQMANHFSEMHGLYVMRQDNIREGA